MRFSMSALVAGALFSSSLLVGCATGDGETPEPEEDVHADLPFKPAGENDAPNPAAYGPYAVGVRTLTFFDDSRTTNDSGNPRKLTVEVWYPATDEARDATDEYLLWDFLAEEQQPLFEPDDFGALVAGALRDAPVRDQETYPVIMFSHGKGGIRMQSTFYTPYLASHGYVVVSPDHEGDTLVELLDELQTEGDIGISSTTDSFIDRPIDISFVMSELENLDANDPLKSIISVDDDGKLDPVGMTGHSFGALTSFRTAGFDWRIDAVVAQTPVGIGLVELALEVPVAEMGIPYMIQNAGMDRTLPADLHADSVWEAMVPPRFSLTLSEAGHFTYSDMCVLDLAAIDEALEIDASNVLEDGCGPENIGTDAAFPVIRHYAVGFFNGYLRHSPGSLDLLTQPLPDDIALADDTIEFLAEFE